MRNILEYYFSFVKKKDRLKDVLTELSDKYSDFKPFNRYINRSSHSDSVNINDFNDIDSSRFAEIFRLIFERTGFLEHYNTMMGIEEPVNEFELPL
jgi:wobble nucleotide-excising tRNase